MLFKKPVLKVEPVFIRFPPVGASYQFKTPPPCPAAFNRKDVGLQLESSVVRGAVGRFIVMYKVLISVHKPLTLFATNVTVYEPLAVDV